jgi:hypothetical protein
VIGRTDARHTVRRLGVPQDGDVLREDGLDFTVEAPDELREHLAALAARLARAAAAPPGP